LPSGSPSGFLEVWLAQEERLHYAKRLQQLMADLTALGEEITAQRDAVAKEIQQLPGHKKATKAYRKTDKEEDKK